jgi:uncharacterized protein
LVATLPDLLFVSLFAIALPLLDYAIFWPAFQRRAEVDPAQAKKWLYVWCIPSAWITVAIGVAIWVSHKRPWAALGFVSPQGWRLWVATALVVLLVIYTAYSITVIARSTTAKSSIRKQIGTVAGVMPQTRNELYWFGGLSLTAGCCEEFLFRGYFIWALAPWLSWWGAAALSLLIFAAWHAYQGWNGVFRTAVVGAVLTLVLALTGSLWHGIILHTLIDLGSGIMAWLALREQDAAP